VVKNETREAVSVNFCTQMEQFGANGGFYFKETKVRLSWKTKKQVSVELMTRL